MRTFFSRTYRSLDRRIDLWSRLAARVEAEPPGAAAEPGALAELRQIRKALELEAEPDQETQASMIRAMALWPVARPGGSPDDGTRLRRYLLRVAAGILFIAVCGISFWVGDQLLFDVSVLAYAG